MSLRYLNGSSWAAISREERLYCAELWFRARDEPSRFATLLNQRAGLQLDPEASWELGYEVCFYRDVLHHRRQGKRASNLPLKRTFDLAMLSSDHIVIIEAKVCEPFTAEQGEAFRRDRQHLAALIGDSVQVSLVPLASRRYFDAFKKYGAGPALAPFDSHRLTWEDVYAEYGGETLARAGNCTTPIRDVSSRPRPSPSGLPVPEPMRRSLISGPRSSRGSGFSMS